MPLNTGDRLYTAGLAAALARAGARVKFLGLRSIDDTSAPREGLDEAVLWEEVAGSPATTFKALGSRYPVVAARHFTNEYVKALRRELSSGQYDAVVLDQYGMVWALPELRRGPGRALTVHIAHDFESEVTRQIARSYEGSSIKKVALHLNAVKTRWAELELAKNCDVVVSLTSEDAGEFRKLSSNHVTLVIPPGYSGEKLARREITSATPRRVVLIGSFQWIAKQINLENFLNSAANNIQRAGVDLQVIGSIPSDLRLRLASEFPFVSFRGFVPDIAAEMAEARLALVIDEVGGGFKLKILDYIFNRCPIAAVRASLGGVPPDLQRHFLTASTAVELSSLLVNRIDDFDFLNSVQVEAFDAADALFDWDKCGALLFSCLMDSRRLRASGT